MFSYKEIKKVTGKWSVMIFLLTMLPMMAASCIDRNVVFHKYVTLNKNGWDSCSYVNLYFENDTANLYTDNIAMEVVLRSDLNYKFANLWLEISDNIKDSLTYAVDTIEVTMATEDGTRLGNASAGIYQLSIPYKNYTNVRKGRINVRIRHLMNHSPLTGLKNVGICLKKR